MPARIWILITGLSSLLIAPAPAAVAEAPRTISLQIDPSPITYGDPITLTGTVSADDPSCEGDVEVGFFFDEADDVGFGGDPHIDWFEMRGRTAADGTFTFSQDLPRPGRFWAGVAEDASKGCDEAISEDVSVGIRHLVALTARDTSIRAGGIARLVAEVSPSCGYTYLGRNKLGPGKVFLEEMEGSGFRRAAGEPVERITFHPCRVVFRQQVSRTTVFRAMTPPRTGGLCCGYMRGWSEPLEIRVWGRP